MCTTLYLTYPARGLFKGSGRCPLQRTVHPLTSPRTTCAAASRTACASPDDKPTDKKRFADVYGVTSSTSCVRRPWNGSNAGAHSDAVSIPAATNTATALSSSVRSSARSFAFALAIFRGLSTLRGDRRATSRAPSSTLRPRSVTPIFEGKQVVVHKPSGRLPRSIFLQPLSGSVREEGRLLGFCSTSASRRG